MSKVRKVSLSSLKKYYKEYYKEHRIKMIKNAKKRYRKNTSACKAYQKARYNKIKKGTW